jgi:hypothetical protein
MKSIKFVKEPFLLYLFNINNVVEGHGHNFPEFKCESYTYVLIERARQIKPLEDSYGIYQL